MPPRKVTSPDPSAAPPRTRGRKAAAAPESGAKADPQASSPLGIEAELWKSADKLRGNLEPSDYKQVALGLIFLKYISDAFEALHQQLLDDAPDMAQERDAYLAENVFWMPTDVRWSFLQQHSKSVEIGAHIDRAMQLIEKENPFLKGRLSKEYARPSLNRVMLGELVDTLLQPQAPWRQQQRRAWGGVARRGKLRWNSISERPQDELLGDSVLRLVLPSFFSI